MERSGWSLPALLVGIGVGAVGGAQVGTAAIWPGVVAGVVGVGLSLVGSRPATISEEAKAQPPGEGTGLSGLGSRVEQILRLAERQADDHRARAEREAERTLAEARSEARQILDRARAEAAGLAEAPKPAAE